MSKKKVVIKKLVRKMDDTSPWNYSNDVFKPPQLKKRKIQNQIKSLQENINPKPPTFLNKIRKLNQNITKNKLQTPRLTIDISQIPYPPKTIRHGDDPVSPYKLSTLYHNDQRKAQLHLFQKEADREFEQSAFNFANELKK